MWGNIQLTLLSLAKYDEGASLSGKQAVQTYLSDTH